jgi:manganese/zinc/iron transport system ATP- binding protein
MSKIYQALTVENLTVHYSSSLALFDVSFSIPSQKIVGIIGPNGAGKSTLIKAILGITPKVHGTIQIFNRPFEQMSSSVAYIPQRQSIDWNFPITVLEVVLMGGFARYGFFKRPSKQEREKALLLLEQFGLKELAKRQISELSGGQQQRLFLARAMMQDATIYFFDEPFVGVDLATEKMLIQTFKDLKKLGKTIFIVHHDLSTIQEYFDWLILLKQRLVACGNTEVVLTKENLKAAYGLQATYFEEILTRAVKQKQGLV